MLMKHTLPPTTSPKRTAGRPRAFEREAALGTAMELFWRHGFDGTSTSQLTTAMGISPPSLYAAFGSKDALYREAVTHYLKKYGEFFSGPMSQSCTAREALERVLLGAAKQFGQTAPAPGCMVACGELFTSPDNALLKRESAERRQENEHAIRARLEAARKSGELSTATDTATLAAYYAMVIQGMAVQARDGATPAKLKRMAQLAMEAWPSC